MTAGRLLLALLAGVIGGAIGIVGGWYLSVFVGLAVFPDSNLAPLPFLCTLWPLVTIGCIALAVYVSLRSQWRGDTSINGDEDGPTKQRTDGTSDDEGNI